MQLRLRHSTGMLSIAATGALVLAGCSTAATPDSESQERATPMGATITMSYDGGVLVLDSSSLATISDISLDGYLRLYDGGDGRHIVATTSEGFVPIDTAAGSDDTPQALELLMEAEAPGHAVPHAGTTLLWDDATGQVGAFATQDLANSPDIAMSQVEHAHHGVAVALEDNTRLITLGTSDSRNGVAHIDEDGHELASATNCPGVHGEGTLGDVVLFGCEDGVLMFSEGSFTKIQAPDGFGRTGNLYLAESSAVAVGDYNSDPDAEGVELSALTLIDTVADTHTVVNLPDGVTYTWRGADRTEAGDIVVLGTDGALHILDEQGNHISNFDVVAPWESPLEWQDAHPNLEVQHGIAYVTEPATNQIHAVDLATGDVTSESVAKTPIELTVVG